MAPDLLSNIRLGQKWLLDHILPMCKLHTKKFYDIDSRSQVPRG